MSKSGLYISEAYKEKDLICGVHIARIDSVKDGEPTRGAVFLDKQQNEKLLAYLDEFTYAGKGNSPDHGITEKITHMGAYIHLGDVRYKPSSPHVLIRVSEPQDAGEYIKYDIEASKDENGERTLIIERKIKNHGNI